MHQEPFELPTYLDMFRESPWQAVKEIGGAALILGFVAVIVYLKDILLWIERSLP